MDDTLQRKRIGASSLRISIKAISRPPERYEREDFFFRSDCRATTMKGTKKMNKTVLIVFTAVVFAVTNGFAYDDPDEFEAALARASQSKPRLKAAGATLLSATGDDNTYWATGDLNVTGRYGEPLYFTFEIPKNYTHITSATLTMDAYDVDAYSTERDEVYFNDVHVGTLTGDNNIWHVNTFPVPASAIKSGVNNLCIRIEVSGWITRISDVKLVIDGVTDYIVLEASQNYDDRIQLTWEVSPGLSGARYFIDRRQNPDKPFKCLNENKPIRERRYDDMTALAGVKYYYRVRSESGIMSEQVIGKRVAKTVEPKIHFALTGRVCPNPVGSSEEEDILVEGKQFDLIVWAEDITKVLTIKNFKLLGEPQGGAKSQVRHVYQYQDVINLQNNYPYNGLVEVISGKGRHGKYKWKIACDYEYDGVSYLNRIIDGPVKNVYFDRDGTDNGEEVNGWDMIKWKFDDAMKKVQVPNWFVYWKLDGACPGLNDPKVKYRGLEQYGEYNPYHKCVFIDVKAGRHDTASDIIWDRQRKINKNMPKIVNGIKLVEATVTHELQHKATQDRYDEKYNRLLGDLSNDSDRSETVCAIKTGGYALCKDHDEANRIEKCDSIVDDDETNGVVFCERFEGKEYRVEGLNPEKVDTFNMRDILNWWEYGGYGDDEFVARIAECLGVDKAVPGNDWAYPGEQAGGLMVESKRSSTKLSSESHRLSSSLKLLNAGENDLPSNANLSITVRGISCRRVLNENCVTGIVYTIGVSIQGDEHVNFNGELINAQSNVVATATSFGDSESDSVELLFDARDIFENYNGGSLILGRVTLTVNDNYSTNNVLGVLYDFAVDPIEVNKDELLCNKGHILDTVINEQSETGVVATISTKINIADGYLVSAELVSTNDELVAFTSVSNLCVVGTNMFRLAFPSDAIYQNGISGICAVKNVKLWQNDELIDADATGAELSAVYDCSDFVPSNACVAVDQNSGRFIEPSMTTDGKLSSLRFVFDVTNSTDATIGYDVAAVLIGTNSALVASVNTPVYVTSGVNQIELSIPASEIAASGEDGPYRFESIELQPQGDSVCGTTYRPNMLSGVYGASDFGALAVKPYGAPRFIETSDYDKLTFEYSYETFRAGAVIAEIVLADKDGNLAANVTTTNEVSEIGVKTNVMTIALHDLSGNDAGAPYVVASLSLRPDISGEEPVYADTVSLTNILWLIAPPEFSPTTRTVFFGSSQPVVISCATPEAEIRYTLDGTEPTESSLIYDGSLVISNSVTLKARAFAEYMRPSETTVAEYVHAAIVGGNLVQDGSPTAGVPQVLSIPVPGTYKVSFDYSQGGDIELRLAGNGTTNTLAVIAAASAGSTNFLFEVAEAGKYELSIYDLSLGVAQPADVSSLSICIPDTGRNRSRYWIYETENTFGSTGEWVTESGFVNGKMPVNGRSVFTAAQQSSGRNVTILTTMEFDSIVDRDAYADELEGVKCGITLGRREDGAPSFLVLSSENGQKAWLNVSGAGLSEPILEKPYTIKLTFDCTNRTYEVSLVERGGHETPLTYGTTNCFSYAENTDAAIYQVGYNGCGNILSLHGVDDYPEASFMQGDALSLNGSQTPAITEGEAAWLNSVNSYDVVKSKVASMSRQDIVEAYLLNLDITQDVFGLDVFKVSGVEVTETEVRIHVWLNRIGAIQVDNGGGTKNAPINGILRLYGGATPQTKDLLNATVMTDANFSEGNTATITYPRNGGARFFRPIIESQAD